MLAKLALAAAALLAASAADAATLDFTTLGSGTIPGASHSVPGASLLSASDSLYVGAGGIPNSICALDSSAFSCANDLTLTFDGLASNISLDVGGFEPGDAVVAFLYNISDVLVGFVGLGAGHVDFTGFTDIKKIFFDDSSTAHGASYGNITYNGTVNPVPLPAGVVLFGTALAGLAALGRRRRVA